MSEGEKCSLSEHETKGIVWLIGFLVICWLLFKLARSLWRGLYTCFIAELTGATVNWKKLGKWAVVTGSTDGIGKAYAKALAAKGFNIVLISRTQEKLDTVAQEIEKKYGVQTKTIAIDITGEPLIYDKIRREIEDLEIGVLVNNVGMSYQYAEYLTKVPNVEKFADNLIKANIVSCTRMTLIALPIMERLGKGVILNVSSLSALSPVPLLSMYSASKKSQVQLSTEELRVLRECNKESFYYRCLPFAVAGMTATFFAIKQGYLKGHPRWGPAGKMSAAAALGWFLGKFSYRSICEDKFLKLENSNVGNAIRKKRGYVSETFDTEKIPEEEFGSPDSKYTSYTTNDYHSSSGSLNLDVDKNITYSGLDDRERPSTDKEALNVEDGVHPHRETTTYEELRRRNREQYERQQNRQSQTKQESFQTGGGQRPWNRDEPPKRYTSGQSDGNKKNAYGDVWEP